MKNCAFIILILNHFAFSISVYYVVIILFQVLGYFIINLLAESDASFIYIATRYANALSVRQNSKASALPVKVTFFFSLHDFDAHKMEKNVLNFQHFEKH